MGSEKLEVESDNVASGDLLLAQCPFCDYSLEGLPVEHTCPECGQPFDRRWQVFGGTSLWDRSKFACFLLLLPFAVAHLMFAEMLIRYPRPWILIPIVGLFFVYAMLMIPFVRRPPGFVAVGPMGVTVSRRGGHRRADYRWPTLTISLQPGIYLRAENKDLNLVSGYFRVDPFGIMRCKRAILRGKRASEQHPDDAVPGAMLGTQSHLLGSTEQDSKRE